MSDQNEGWDTIEVPSKNEDNKIEFEVEGEEEKEEVLETVEEQPKEKVVEAAPQEEIEEEPKELDGIKTKGAERRIRQLIKQRKEREEQIENLIAQNEELKQNLQNKTRDLTNVTNTTINRGQEHLEKNIELARQAYLEAFDSGDKEKALAAQETLSEAKAELKNIQNWKAKVANQQETLQQQPVQQERSVQSSVDPKAQEWAESNEWFGKDTIKTAAALALDAELKNEGYDPNDDEFYEEIDKRLETAFGQTSQRVQDNTKEPAQVVSGSSRSSPTSSKKVKLSKEDVRLANKWGIPLEQYAAEKMKVTQADGEYTNII
jgi:hypothetical protein